MSIAKFNMESGYHQADQLFGRAPELDCLFCATDSIALGALQYCRSHSLRVPEDIMIAAVGDNRIGRVAYVPLTSASFAPHFPASLRGSFCFVHPFHTVPCFLCILPKNGVKLCEIDNRIFASWSFGQ